MIRLIPSIIVLTLIAATSQAHAQGVPASRVRPASAPAAKAPPVTAGELPARAKASASIDGAQSLGSGSRLDPNTQIDSTTLKSVASKQSQEADLIKQIMQNSGHKGAVVDGIPAGGAGKPSIATQATARVAGGSSVNRTSVAVECPQCRRPRDLKATKAAPHP